MCDGGRVTGPHGDGVDEVEIEGETATGIPRQCREDLRSPHPFRRQPQPVARPPEGPRCDLGIEAGEEGFVAVEHVVDAVASGADRLEGGPTEALAERRIAGEAGEIPGEAADVADGACQSVEAIADDERLRDELRHHRHAAAAHRLQQRDREPLELACEEEDMLVGHLVGETGGREPPGKPHRSRRHERRGERLELGAVFAIAVERELVGNPALRERSRHGDHVVEPLLGAAQLA